MVRLVRRGLLLAGVLLLVSCSEKANTPFGQDWQTFVQRFYDNGRIVDTGNDGVSHSEGQGYGMLFAAVAGDKTRFDALWRWTRQTLQRDDGLFSWRYRPCPEHNTACVDDPNNASDGDILIAWALLRAAQVWDSQTYRQQAVTILNAIEDKLIVERQGLTVLLPGAEGFVRNGSVQLNLSYWIFPAFNAFYTQTHQPVWSALSESGKTLLAQAQWGDYGLPADWMWLQHDGLSLADTVSPEYGFNAVRIPLHLAWQRYPDDTLLAPFIKWYAQPTVPATLNLDSGESADYQWSAGMQAIAEVVRYRAKLDERQPQLRLGNEQDYYAASLIMLSQLVLMDTSS